MLQEYDLGFSVLPPVRPRDNHQLLIMICPNQTNQQWRTSEVDSVGVRTCG